MPDMLTQSRNLLIRIWWSTVAITELRSRSTNTEQSPTLEDIRMLLETLRRAVSVECCFRNPDWNFFCLSNAAVNWLATTFSKIFDRNGSLDIALGVQVLGWILDLIAIILSTKKVRNLLQSSIEKHGNVESSGETMLLIVSNEILGFLFEEELAK